MQMRQRVSNSAGSGDLSDSPMLGGVPLGPEVDEGGAQGEGSKNKDNLYLFTRGQVFKKSSRRLSLPSSRISTFGGPVPSPGIMKLPLPSFMSYPDSGGFDTTTGLVFGGHHHQDGGFMASYSSHHHGHGNSGYHSSSSTPGMPTALMPGMDLFPLEGSEQLGVFGGGEDHGVGASASWISSFGIPDGASIGFGR